MAKAKTITEYKRGSRVVLVEVLPGIPRGTAGKIGRSIGFDLKRYRVRFDNQVEEMSVAHSLLVPAKMWPALAKELAKELQANPNEGEPVSSTIVAPAPPVPEAAKPRSQRPVAQSPSAPMPGVLHVDPPPADIEITEPDTFVPGPEVDARSHGFDNRVFDLLQRFKS